MATLIAEAVEIITEFQGVPQTGLSLSQFGLNTDGHFYLITDRFGLNGSKTITGDTTQTVWYERILSRDFGNWTLSRNIDFVDAGAFESVSDWTVGIINTAGFRAALQSNGIYLGRRKVRYYRVTSSDGTTFNFEQRWEGVVDDKPFNERLCSLRCVSTFKDLFGSLPTVPANDIAFPDIPENNRDKMVPIAVGRSARSPLLTVKGAGKKTILASISGTSYTFAGCAYVDGTGKIVRIKTNGVTFVADDTRLVGKYLSQIDGAETQTLRIISNLATNTTDASNPYTQVVLADALTGTPVLWTLANDTVKPWFFEVLDLSVTLVASSAPVSEMVKNESGQPRLARYATDESRFEDLSEVGFQTSTTTIEASGFPGYVCRAKSTDTTGDVEFPLIIVPTTVTMVGAPGGTNTFPAVGETAPLLNDVNPSTGYTMHMGITGFFPTFDQFTLDLEVADLDSLGTFDGFYVLPNFSMAAEVLSATVGVNAIISLVDIYGRSLATGINHNFPVGVVDTGGTTFNLLPQFYFGSPDNPTLDALYNGGYGGPLDIHSLIADSKVANIYQRIRVEFFFNNVNGDAYHFTLEEIGIVAVKKANLTTETLYGQIKGEVYGTTIDGRVDATDFPDTVVRILEYLIRTKDEKGAPWRSGTYTAGEFVRSTADNGHIFVCTVGGTTAGTEPTWTTTAGATYTDGGVTWKEHHAIRIDTASFDSAASHRGFWFAGRTLTEKKDSLEYYQSLFAQAFLLGVTAADGKVQVKPWLQNTTPLVAFSESNILPGTLGDVVETPVRRIANDLLIQYDKNPGSGGFNKQIAVTNIDKPAFPSITETVVTGTNLGTFSVTSTFSFDFTNPTWTFTFVTTAAHGRSSGDYISLSGNTNGYDFAAVGGGQMSVVDTHTFKIIGLTNTPTASPSTTGTLLWNPVSRLKWQDYVAGIQNYSTAQDLWQQCHNSWIVTQVINKTPTELGQCEWFFDWYAQDASGKYIWSTDGGLTPEYDLGDAHAATGLAEGIANWTAWQKKQVTFETADTSTFSARGLGDCVSFADQKLTASVAMTGWIHEKTQLPKSGDNLERFRFGVTLYPEALVTYAAPTLIIESGSWPDTITESGSRTDTYTEGA